MLPPLCRSAETESRAPRHQAHGPGAITPGGRYGIAATGNGIAQTGTNGGFDIWVTYAQTGAAATAGQGRWRRRRFGNEAREEVQECGVAGVIHSRSKVGRQTVGFEAAECAREPAGRHNGVGPRGIGALTLATSRLFVQDLIWRSETRLRGWACETRTQKRRRKLSL